MHRNTRDLDAVEELSCTSEAAMYNIYIYNHLYLYTYLNTTCITYIYIYEYYVNIKIIMFKKIIIINKCTVCPQPYRGNRGQLLHLNKALGACNIQPDPISYKGHVGCSWRPTLLAFQRSDRLTVRSVRRLYAVCNTTGSAVVHLVRPWRFCRGPIWPGSAWQIFDLFMNYLSY